MSLTESRPLSVLCDREGLEDMEDQAFNVTLNRFIYGPAQDLELLRQDRGLFTPRVHDPT